MNSNKTLYLNKEKCILDVSKYQHILKYNTQMINQRRKKRFYKFKNKDETIYLMTLDLLCFDNYKNICVPSLIPNKYCTYTKNLLNDYLVGYKENKKGEKEYFITEFRFLPENVDYCYKNIIYNY